MFFPRRFRYGGVPIALFLAPLVRTQLLGKFSLIYQPQHNVGYRQLLLAGSCSHLNTPFSESTILSFLGLPHIVFTDVFLQEKGRV